MMNRTDDSGSGGYRRVLVADSHHVALIVAVVVTVWALITALLVIEIRRKDRDLDVILSRTEIELQQAREQATAESQRAYEQGRNMGQIESAERMILQLDLRLQAAEVALGIRADVEESMELDDMEKP